jgi:hypothetical protein
MSRRWRCQNFAKAGLVRRRGPQDPVGFHLRGVHGRPLRHGALLENGRGPPGGDRGPVR